MKIELLSNQKILKNQCTWPTSNGAEICVHFLPVGKVYVPGPSMLEDIFKVGNDVYLGVGRTGRVFKFEK